MAVFIAGADESESGDQKGQFFYGGFIAAEPRWTELTAAWNTEVLDSPTAIPYLHMVEIRSRRWREEHGLTEYQADCKADAAAKLIRSFDHARFAVTDIPGGRFREVFRGARMRRSPPKQFGAYALEPDYVGFLGFARGAVEYVAGEHANAERVDFLIERKTGITPNLEDFIGSLKRWFKEAGRPALVDLVGKLMPGNKRDVGLQAADVGLWHLRRYEERLCNWGDLRRLQTMFNDSPLISSSIEAADIEGLGERAAARFGPCGAGSPWHNGDQQQT